MGENKKLYQKWWFWVCIALIIFIICIIFNYINNIVINANLNQKVTIGKLTYYIDDNWESTENVEENTTYKYYYPTNNTMLMIMFQTGDNYGDDTTINVFLDSYVSGMNLNDNDLISKDIKKINNLNCGVIRCYLSQYETIQYIIPNNDEAYVFTFGQKNKLNKQNINIIENIVEKVTVTTEVEDEEEKQINEPNPNTQTDNTLNNNQNNISNSQTNALTNEKPIENHSQPSKPSTNTNQQHNNNLQTNKPTKQENPSTSQSKPNETQPTETVNVQSKYQAILNEYSTKLKNKTPLLITEYKNEASKNTNGLNGLATICNNKVSILAEISTEGIGKMADIYYEYGNGKYSEYESWAGKLQDVYMEEAGKIQDVYMDSAMQ